MGFDKSDGQPLVHLRRWGTKVNFATVLAVIIFLVFGGFAIGWIHSHKDKIVNDIHQKMEEKR
jgi:hypothetical protein